MDRYLIKTLIFPLFAATALAMFLSFKVKEPWTGLWVNLAAGFIGTAMTVMYVDVVLRRREQREWDLVKKRIKSRIAFLANAAITSIRTTVQVGPEIFEKYGLDPSDPNTCHRIMADIADGPELRSVLKIRQLNGKQWHTVCTGLNQHWNATNDLTASFGTRLDPHTMECILALQDSTASLVNSYAMCPELYGCPPDSLPARTDGSSSVPLQQAHYAIAEKQIHIILSNAASLLRAL